MIMSAVKLGQKEIQSRLLLGVITVLHLCYIICLFDILDFHELA